MGDGELGVAGADALRFRLQRGRGERLLVPDAVVDVDEIERVAFEDVTRYRRNAVGPDDFAVEARNGDADRRDAKHVFERAGVAGRGVRTRRAAAQRSP